MDTETPGEADGGRLAVAVTHGPCPSTTRNVPPWGHRDNAEAQKLSSQLWGVQMGTACPALNEKAAGEEGLQNRALPLSARQGTLTGHLP